MGYTTQKIQVRPLCVSCAGGGIVLCVNNAAAIGLESLNEVLLKRFNLMLQQVRLCA